MRSAGTDRRRVLLLWCAVAAICTVASVAGYAIADAVPGELRAAIDGFAAGALLVMLIDAMIPEATREVGARRRPCHNSRLCGGRGPLQRFLHRRTRPCRARATWAEKVMIGNRTLICRDHNAKFYR